MSSKSKQKLQFFIHQKRKKINITWRVKNNMERHSCLIWPKRRLYIQDIVSLCQFIITLYGLVISLCGFVIILCQFFISLCGFIFMLCHLAFRYVGLSLCYVDFSFRYVSYTLSLCYISASLCSVIVSLHYGNLFYFISDRHFVMWVCSFVMPMLYFVMSFFYVVMWTNLSIMSINVAPVGNCICRYQSEKAETVIRKRFWTSTRLDTTLTYFTKHSNSTQHVHTRPDPTPPIYPTLLCHTTPYPVRCLNH